MTAAIKLREALKASISPPFTVRYPYVPSPPPPTFRGKPEYDEDKCVGCGICVERCPSEAIEVEDLGAERRLIIHYEYCVYCANCNYKCMPLEGVKPSRTQGATFKGRSHAVFTVTKPTPIVKVDEDSCIGCARCQYACSFGAAKVVKKGDRWVSSIDPVACKGCGLCASVCPAIVIDPPLSLHDSVIMAVRESPENHIPGKSILAFHCNWVKAGLEELAGHFSDVGLKFINITCSGRLNPIFVLEAFNSGYGGVMVLGCPEEECHFEGGGPQNAKTVVGALKRLLDEAGIEPGRLELVLGSNTDPYRYRDAIARMADRLGEIRSKRS